MANNDEVLNNNKSGVGASPASGADGIAASAAADLRVIRDEYNSFVNEVSIARDESTARISGLYEEIRSGYSDHLLDSDELLADSREAISNEVTNIANSYNNQVSREAERVDALVAGGALGGNAYRAYQAHTQVTRDLMAQASGQISSITLQAIDSLTKDAIAIGAKNQTFYTETMARLSEVAAKQAEVMIGYSDLLSVASARSSESLARIYGVQLSSISIQNELYLGTRALDNQIRVSELAQSTSIEVAKINGWYALESIYVRNEFASDMERSRASNAIDLLNAEYGVSGEPNATGRLAQPARR